MIFHFQGKMNGKRIELEKDPGLPPGSPVTVHVEPAPLSIEERRRRIEDSCGAWKDDQLLRVVFKEILAARRDSRPRDLKFDVSS